MDLDDGGSFDNENNGARENEDSSSQNTDNTDGLDLNGAQSLLNGEDEEDGGRIVTPGMLRDQDRFLPIANVARIMKRVIPESGKVSKEAKESCQECVSEFISFITSEASERCANEKRKTINGEDILYSIQALGFDNYVEPLKLYLLKYRDACKTGPETSGNSETTERVIEEPVLDFEINDMDDSEALDHASTSGERPPHCFLQENQIHLQDSDGNPVVAYIVDSHPGMSQQQEIANSQLHPVNQPHQQVYSIGGQFVDPGPGLSRNQPGSDSYHIIPSEPITNSTSVDGARAGAGGSYHIVSGSRVPAGQSSRSGPTANGDAGGKG